MQRPVKAIDSNSGEDELSSRDLEPVESESSRPRRHHSLIMPDAEAPCFTRRFSVFFVIFFFWTLYTSKMMHHCTDPQEMRTRLRSLIGLEGMVSALLFTITTSLMRTSAVTARPASDPWILQHFTSDDAVQVEAASAIICTICLVLNIFHLFVTLTSLSPLMEATPNVLLTEAVREYLDGPGKILSLVFALLIMLLFVVLVLRAYIQFGKVILFTFAITMLVLQPLYYLWAWGTWPLFSPIVSVRLGMVGRTPKVCSHASKLSEDTVTAVAGARTRKDPSELVAELERLASLRMSGMLSENEFAAAKQCVLRGSEGMPDMRVGVEDELQKPSKASTLFRAEPTRSTYV
eukprot:TRINITY_DN83035_c0_g1_i1.p1 TRINITY_DN83035_c0_g1~~TRINITY_DN83035_c0_g1_i1.p1  ORF type:complete len:360 (-),score=50.04 TRINITY_DN83035_c0_g1_i1:71-1117(-)